MRKLIRVIGKWFCRIGWHGELTYTGFDGASLHARCERCGYVGLVDSGGELF